MEAKSIAMKVFETMEEFILHQQEAEGDMHAAAALQFHRVLGLVEAGFPSPAEEELRDTLSLDEYLIQNPDASFLLKVSGDSMVNAGILPGDMVIVDRGQTGKSGDIVIAEVDGEWTMKFFKKSGDVIWLVPANPKYKPIRPQRELKIAGVVTAVVRKYQRGANARGRGAGHAVESMENG
ncbi:MAG TPA: transcriptional repressor LexA [Nitrospirota bacterium]|nr:transcriptional repressor LexA [Nitrospirota bacterium]